jgi:hypothetical protein
MATYTKVSRSLSSMQRSALIEDVAVGDQIDIVDVLGRAARGVKLRMTDATDVADYKLNSLVRLPKFNEGSADEQVLVWSASPKYSTYRSEGELEHVTADELLVSSIEIVALTLSSGTTIELVVW